MMLLRFFFFFNCRSAADIDKSSHCQSVRPKTWSTGLSGWCKYLRKSVLLCSYGLATASLERKLTLWKCVQNLDMAHKYHLLGSIRADILSHRRIYYFVRLHVLAIKSEVCWPRIMQKVTKICLHFFFILKVA